MITRGSKDPGAVISVVTDFRDARADYEMSKTSRFVRQRTGLAPGGGPADFHYRNEAAYYRDIEKARDMDRNDAIVGQTLDRAVANIVQDGFTLDPKTGSRKLDAELWKRWQDWSHESSDCDIVGESSFHDFESLAMRSMLLDGDCGFMGLVSGHLQMHEAHVIQTSTSRDNTHLGVEVDTFGRHVRYWIMSDSVDRRSIKKEIAQPVEVYTNGMRTFFHVYKPKRKSLRRGVTAFAPIFALTGMFEDIQFAKLVQQQVVSCFAIFKKKAANSDPLPSADGGFGSQATETTSTGQVRQIENLSPAMMIEGNPGEELQGFSPNVPNSEYFEHVKLMLQMIGVNLGLPLCLVLMDGSETNFSGWRGAVDEARKGFRDNQRNLVRRFHTPVYKWKVQQWIEESADLRLMANSSRVDVFKHKFNAPSWQYIDPVDDAKGDKLRLENALISPRRLHAERGHDWEEVSDEIVSDNAQAIIRAKKQAVKINESIEDNQPVHWRDLISLPMPSGVTMSMQDPQIAAAADDGGRRERD